MEYWPVFLTPWKTAMVAILPLMGRLPRIRTWLAMFLNSIAAMAFVSPSPGGYIAIDLLAGALVLVAPAGLAQRLIGLLFACMVMFHAGFLLAQWWATSPPNIALYLSAQRIVGWAQWAVLVGWGTIDVVKSLARRRRADRGEMVAQGRF